MSYKRNTFKAKKSDGIHHGTAYCGKELRRIVELREMGWDWESIAVDPVIQRHPDAVKATYRNLRRADLFYHGADDETLVSRRVDEKRGKRKPGIKPVVTEVKGVSRVIITPKSKTKK